MPQANLCDNSFCMSHDPRLQQSCPLRRTQGGWRAGVAKRTADEACKPLVSVAIPSTEVMRQNLTLCPSLTGM